MEQFSFSDFLLLWSKSPALLGNRPAGPGRLATDPSPGQRNHGWDGCPSLPRHRGIPMGPQIHPGTSMGMPGPTWSDGVGSFDSKGAQGVGEMPTNQAKVS